ncbi:MAG TPA: transposase [Gaiellaceae bacterium]|nr:transposase [Gaiellaceae bacterium]
MPRRQPLDFAGLFLHVTTRGIGRAPVFFDEFDYVGWLRIFEQTVHRFKWRCHAYCLMPNHFHLLIELVEPTLALGMRHLNGSYAQRINLRNERTGHLFEGPYRPTLVERDEHFLETCRYIVLNPVRAHLCADAADWPWSSYRATAGLAHRPPYLVVDAVRRRFGKGPDALESYRSFVAAGAMSLDLVGGR